MEKQLIIRGTPTEVMNILDRLTKQFPNKTLVEVTDSYSKDVLVLE